MWSRRFRLPTRYVLPQKASPLASRSHRGNLPVCHLAFGRAPSRGPGCCSCPRAQIYPRAEPSSSWTAKWTRRRFGSGTLSGMVRAEGIFISSQPVGDHAQPCSCSVAARDLTTDDHALMEGPTATSHLILGRTRNCCCDGQNGRPSGRMNPSTIGCGMQRNWTVWFTMWIATR
jgi:hypothetical protein